MALVSGLPPLRLLDGGSSATWTELDLEVLSQWKSMKEALCPGCGRQLSQHLHNHILGREETVEDYSAYSVECPALQAISAGKEMWEIDNKSAIDSHIKGLGADPSVGTYWISKGIHEVLPS